MNSSEHRLGAFLSSLPAGTRIKALKVENEDERHFAVAYPDGPPFMLLTIRADGTFETRTITAEAVPL
jgi:hypothetical protein